MHRLVKTRRRLLAVALVLGTTATVQPLPAQGAPPGAGPEGPLAAISAVLRFRLSWLEDATPVDLCSLYEQAGRPAQFPGEVPAELRNQLGLLNGLGAVTAAPVCPPGSDEPVPRLVQFNRVTISDSVAQIRLRVRKGDQSHIEDYSLKSRILGGWDVVEVRTWGRLYVMPPRRSRER